MARTTARLPKTLRELAHVRYELFQNVAQAWFNHMPQLLVMPSGRRLQWTKKGESSQFDMPWLAFWYNDEKLVKDAMRRIMWVIAEQRYEFQKNWFFKWLTLRTN